MAEFTAIEWADSTFNPWMGCTAVSPACDFCYAEALMDHRYGKVQWGPHGERVRTAPANWQNPRRWQRQATAFYAQHGRRRRVFCASLADVFDIKAPEGAREDLWQLIRETPDLDWLLLTKRPQNIAKMLPAFWSEIAGHVWLGTSTENQEEANRRLPHLLSIAPRPAVYFASAEPLLGPVDFGNVVPKDCYERDVLTGFDFDQGGACERLDWIIVGGESGANARPSHPDWIRGIRDQCAATNVAFLFKQWGEWKDRSDFAADAMAVLNDGLVIEPTPDAMRAADGDASVTRRQPTMMRKVGKKAAGRELDGVTHDGFPGVPG